MKTVMTDDGLNILALFWKAKRCIFWCVFLSATVVTFINLNKPFVYESKAIISIGGIDKVILESANPGATAEWLRNQYLTILRLNYKANFNLTYNTNLISITTKGNNAFEAWKKCNLILASILKNRNGADKIIVNPSWPEQYTSPKFKKDILLFMFIGLLAGVWIWILLKSLRDTLENDELNYCIESGKEIKK